MMPQIERFHAFEFALAQGRKRRTRDSKHDGSDDCGVEKSRE